MSALIPDQTFIFTNLLLTNSCLQIESMKDPVTMIFLVQYSRIKIGKRQNKTKIKQTKQNKENTYV